MKDKRTLDAVQAASLRELVDKVNHINTNSEAPFSIMKEDIVSLQRIEDAYILLFYR